MSNGEICCAAGVCCPPAQARKQYAELLCAAIGCDEQTAQKAADWAHDNFDHLPKGHGLEAIIAYVSSHAKG